ncbi:FtsX-like permease family protein [Microbacterium tumbae]
MIRLAFAELREDTRLWVGPFLVAIVSAAFVYLAAVYWWTLGTPDGAALIESFGSTVDEARAGSYVVYVSTAVPAIAVLGTGAAATVTALSTRIARWRLAGASPSQVRRAITTQVLLVNAVGAVAGIIVASPFCQSAVDLLVRMVTREDHTIPVANAFPAALLAIVGATLVSYFASFIPARRAARISAVHAVRDETEATVTMPVSRWIVAGFAVLFLLQQIIVTIGATLTLGSDSIGGSSAATLSMMTGLAVLAIIVALAPVLVPQFVRLWTAIIPARRLPAWTLARYFATGQPRRTATAVIPIAVGLALYGILFGIITTWQDALTRNGITTTLNSLDTYVMLTPAAVISIAGSIASVLLSTRARTKDAAALRVAGASPRTLIGIAFSEAAAYAFTAIVLGLGIAAASVATTAFMLTAGGLSATPLLDLRQMVVLAGIATAALLTVLLVPALSAIRRNPRDALSAL